MSPTRVFFLLHAIILDLDSFGPLTNKRLGQRTWQTLLGSCWQAERAAKTIAKDYYHQQQQQHRTKTLDLGNILNKKLCLSLYLSLFLKSFRNAAHRTAGNAETHGASIKIQIFKHMQSILEWKTDNNNKKNQPKEQQQTNRSTDRDMYLLGAGAGATIIDDTFDI